MCENNSGEQTATKRAYPRTCVGGGVVGALNKDSRDNSRDQLSRDGVQWASLKLKYTLAALRATVRLDVSVAIYRQTPKLVGRTPGTVDEYHKATKEHTGTPGSHTLC